MARRRLRDPSSPKQAWRGPLTATTPKWTGAPQLRDGEPKPELEQAKHAIAGALRAWIPKRTPVLERWTVDRIDVETGIARIERVRMTRKAYEKLFPDGVPDDYEPDKESRSWWYAVGATSVPCTIDELLEWLKPIGRENVAENRVFWVLLLKYPSREPAGPQDIDGQAVKIEKVIPATKAARALSKELYHKALRVQVGEEP